MKQVDLKIEFSAYYNKKRETFDGGLYPILEYIKENKLKNAIVRLDYDTKNSVSWEEVDIFAPELSIKTLEYEIKNEGKFSEKFIANIKCSPLSAQSLIKILIQMALLGNGGHSYGILINDKKFFFDGDGADHISSINDTELNSEIYKDIYKQIDIYNKCVKLSQTEEVNESITHIKITKNDIIKMVSEAIEKMSQKDIL